MLGRGAVLVGLMLALAVLWVLNCSGPRPSVADVRLEAPQMGQESYRVSALIRNTGPGHGEVDVTFRLRDKRSGQTYQMQQKAVLEVAETTWVSAEIPAPPGDYTPDVDIDYPPR